MGGLYSSSSGLESEDLSATKGFDSKLSHTDARRRLQLFTRGPFYRAADQRASPRVNDPRDSMTKIGAAIFYNLISRMTHFCYILSITQTHLSTMWEGQDMGMKVRRLGSVGTWLEAGCHICCQWSSVGAALLYMAGKFLLGWGGPRHCWTSHILDPHPLKARSPS